MIVKDYVEKLCELGIGNSMLRVIDGDERIYEGTIEGALDSGQAWMNEKIYGVSSFATTASGHSHYSTMISI